MSDDNVLTFEKLERLWHEFFPPLYYQTTAWLDKGDMYYCKETDFSPECVIFHPEDEPVIRKMITARRLVPLSEEPQKAQMERIKKRLEKQVRESFDNLMYKGY